MTADVKNFYLCTPMERHEFMHMHIVLSRAELLSTDAGNRQALATAVLNPLGGCGQE